MTEQDNPFIEKVIHDLVSDTTKSLSVSIGHSISDVYFGLIGSRTQTYASNRMAAELMKREQFINNLVEKTKDMDAEDLKEPEMHIIGPAIEATTFYMENEILREMFEKLILSSMKYSQAEFVHPAFVEIIKQLSPLDAQIIALFTNKDSFPIVQYRLVHKETRNYNIEGTNIFLETENAVENINIIKASITNLVRLGLLSITYENSLSEEGIYDKFTQVELYKTLQRYLDENQELLKELEITKGGVSITPLGESFIRSCII